VRLLLDTHVWLWMLTAPDRLGDAVALVRDARNELLLSAASSWEMTIKHGIGRLQLPAPPASYVPARIRSTGVTPIPVDHSHALEVGNLPPIHADPFDRLLVAQARILGVPLVTADRQLTEYPVETILVP
jgi:PIN domain nuclease of toxin-antitoxin system